MFNFLLSRTILLLSQAKLWKISYYKWGRNVKSKLIKTMSKRIWKCENVCLIWLPYIYIYIYIYIYTSGHKWSANPQHTDCLNRTSCVQAHELSQNHCGDNHWGLIVFMFVYIYIYKYIYMHVIYMYISIYKLI